MFITGSSLLFWRWKSLLNIAEGVLRLGKPIWYIHVLRDLRSGSRVQAAQSTRYVYSSHTIFHNVAYSAILSIAVTVMLAILQPYMPWFLSNASLWNSNSWNLPGWACYHIALSAPFSFLFDDSNTILKALTPAKIPLFYQHRHAFHIGFAGLVYRLRHHATLVLSFYTYYCMCYFFSCVFTLIYLGMRS